MDITNWFPLFRLALRRDRLYLPLWIVGLTALGTFFVPMMPSVAGTDAEMEVLGGMMANPAMVAMCGRLYGDGYTMGIMYTQLMLVWLALAFAAMNILLVIRHTRADEEAGRLEVLGSLPVGRQANLAAVAVLAVVANLVPSLLIGLMMPAFGVEGIGLAGSLVLALSCGAAGLAFAGFTLIVVQVVASSRAATGLAMAAMGVAYLVRAAGDVSAPEVALVSPLGLIERAEPFYSDNLWPAGLLVAATLAAVAVALVLNRARDIGLGLLPQRPGRAHAARTLSGESGLAWRLTRGTVIGWAIAVFVIAASYGSIMGDMSSFLESSEMYQQLMQVSPGDADLTSPVVATLQQIMAIIGAVPVILVVHRLAAEEKKSRLDQVLGTAASRTRLFVSFGVIALAAAVVMEALSGLGFGVVAQAVMTTDPADLSMVMKCVANLIPAVLIYAGLGLALVGWFKQATAITWVYLVVAFFGIYLDGMVDLPKAMQEGTPFGFMPRYPVEAWSWPRWIALLAIALALAIVGLLGYRRRDVTS